MEVCIWGKLCEAPYCAFHYIVKSSLLIILLVRPGFIMSFVPILPRKGADSNGNTVTQQSDPSLRNPLKSGSSIELESSRGTLAISLPPLSSLTRMPGSMFSSLPPPPGPSESPELIQHWLRAKAEEDRRVQEVERTQQERLKLEQRKAEQAILNEALRAGVPPHMVPSIFASMVGAWSAQQTLNTAHGRSFQPYAHGSAQPYSHPARSTAPVPPTYYSALSNPAQAQHDMRYWAPNTHIGTGPYNQPAPVAASSQSVPTGAFAPIRPQQPQGVPAQHQTPVNGTSKASVSQRRLSPLAKAHSRPSTLGVLQPLSFRFWAPSDHLQSQASPNKIQKESVVTMNASPDKGADFQISSSRIRESAPSPHRGPAPPSRMSNAFQQNAQPSRHASLPLIVPSLEDRDRSSTGRN